VKYFRENLAKKAPEISSCTIAHYFYTFRGTERESTHQHMLRSLLHSILEQDELAFFHFQPQFRKVHRNSSEWPFDSLKDVLLSLADHPSTKPLYLILDAMDESRDVERYDIIALFCKICSAKNSCVKVFLASRPVAALKHQITECHHAIILQDENKNDIHEFTNDFLRDLRLTGPILREATDYIIDNAKGVFVWVDLIKRELRTIGSTGGSERQILDHLRQLPKELVDFYEFTLQKLEKGSHQDIQDGITLFQFTLFALRPPTVAELRHALAIPPDPDRPFTPSHTEFKKKQSSSIERRILHCGGNFLEITGTFLE
jgi:hypothetical protein